MIHVLAQNPHLRDDRRHCGVRPHDRDGYLPARGRRNVQANSRAGGPEEDAEDCEPQGGGESAILLEVMNDDEERKGGPLIHSSLHVSNSAHFARSLAANYTTQDLADARAKMLKSG